MAELKIEVPAVAHLVIAGSTQTGKSIVLARIAEVLKDEFGCQVFSPDIEAERRISGDTALAPWEKKMIKNTLWILSESHK